MVKRALAAIGLSAVILLVWTIFFAPKPPVTPPVSTGTTVPGTGPSLGTAGGSRSPAADHGSDSAAPSPSPGADAKGAAARREAPEGMPPVVVETPLERIEFRNPGARLVSWTLKKYLDHEGRPYELISPDGAQAGVHPLGLQLDDKPLEDVFNSKARFDVEPRP